MREPTRGPSQGRHLSRANLRAPGVASFTQIRIDSNRIAPRNENHAEAPTLRDDLLPGLYGLHDGAIRVHSSLLLRTGFASLLYGCASGVSEEYRRYL